MRIKPVRSLAFLAGLSLAAVGLSSAMVMAAGQGKSQSKGLAALSSGKWELRTRGGNGVERICLGDDLQRLVQLRHRGSTCSHFVVEDSATTLTVQYTCPGRGYGRTQIRRETNQLVQIVSQGIEDGLPFEFVAEGRRVGACS